MPIETPKEPKEINVFWPSVVSVVISITLLITGYLSGAQFVALVIAIAVMGLAFKVLPDIKKLSIMGYTLELREKLNEAAKLTRDLETLKRKTLVLQLQAFKVGALGSGGGYGGFNFRSVIESLGRFTDFALELHKDGSTHMIKSELLEGIKEWKHLFISSLRKELGDDSSDFDTFKRKAIEKNAGDAVIFNCLEKLYQIESNLKVMLTTDR